MKQFVKPALLLPVVLILSQIACNPVQDELDEHARLGEQLFNDTMLSRDGTQSCATCHDSKHAFIDPRPNVTSTQANLPGMVSVGQDGTSLGDINTPSAAYTAYVPKFHYDQKEQLYKGGLFLNGRVADLNEQALHPVVNPVEMQNDNATVVKRVKQKYGEQMRALYGADVFSTTEKALQGIANSLAAFEKTEQFASFDSKFDRVLAGEEDFTEQEQRGKELFEAEDKGNCAACHPVPGVQSTKADSLFTDHTYDNLGVPKNAKVRALNGKGLRYVDFGLYDNPAVNEPDLKGAFRVPSLRNVAVTAPYMHNGVFQDLKTVVEFYNSRDVADGKNPETGDLWSTAEIEGTKNTEELGDLGLSVAEVDAIVAFMKTLTDQRYEKLMSVK